MNRAAVDSITLPEARYLSLVAQHLEHPEPLIRKRPNQADLLHVIRAAGVLQLDSISVVSRAHETAVWSRTGTYDPSDLAALHHPQQALIEYWAHAASLLPVEFLPYLRRQMLSYCDPQHPRVGPWVSANRELINQVLTTVEQQGPVSTRAFERPEEIKRNPWDWWGGKPAKQALDYLWTMGELVVLRRVGFERVYELTDRAFPALRSAPLPTMEEQARFFTERALHAVGIGTLPWIADYYRSGSGRYVPAPDMQFALGQLESEGQAVQVELGDERMTAWLDVALLPVLERFRGGQLRPKRSTLLSPFDNLLWQRNRALALFGFDYRLESYTPEPKRVYGYYSLPILIDGSLVGRLDARYRRKERLLSVRSLHLEPGIRPSAALATALVATLEEFTGFLGGGEIELLTANSASFQAMVLRRLS